jgi:hypothetical protein
MAEVRKRLAAQIRAWALNNQIAVIAVHTRPKSEEMK